MAKLIHNPVETGAPIETIFDYKKWVLKPGETVKVTQENEAAAIHLLNTYGFLKVIDADDEEVEKVTDKWICQYCGKECKARIGLLSHEKACDKNPDNMSEEEAKKAKEKLENEDKTKKNIKTLTPKAKLVKKGQSRSAKEDEDFGNTDLAGVVTGKEKTEVGATGDKKKFAYDRDGVGWYGPGVEDDQTDFVASGMRKKHQNGNF